MPPRAQKNPAASAHPLVRPSGLAAPKVHSPLRPSASQMILRACGARIAPAFFVFWCCLISPGVSTSGGAGRNAPAPKASGWLSAKREPRRGRKGPRCSVSSRVTLSPPALRTTGLVYPDSLNPIAGCAQDHSRGESHPSTHSHHSPASPLAGTPGEGRQQLTDSPSRGCAVCRAFGSSLRSCRRRSTRP